MSSSRLLVCSLATLCLGALAPAISAQTKVLNETFAGASTVNSNPASPAIPSPTGVAYQQLAAKTFTPNPPVITPGNLRHGIVATTSGFTHLQALFTKYPVTLAGAGDYIELEVVFLAESGIITAQTNSSLFFGLYNASQVAPLPGGMNGTVATATAGYAQGWLGYVNRIFHAGGNNGFFTRPAKNATDANNQDVLFNYGAGATIGSTAASTLAAFPANSTYTAVFKITKGAGTSLALTSSLYAGAGRAGTPLYTQSANSTTTLTAVYDAVAFGWRATGSVASVMNVKSVVITTTGTTTIIPEIMASPLSVTKSVGDTATFSVTANGGAGTALSYQWLKGGAPIPGAIAASYTIPAVTLDDAGSYAVVVTDVAGSTTSAAATLTVTTGAVAPSFVVEPAGATILAGGSHAFTATVNGTSPLSYQWERSTNGGATYAPIASATGPSYTVASATLADAGLYRLVLTNAVGNATSSGAALVVQQAPSITTQPTGGSIGPGGSITLTVAATGTPAPTYQWRRNGAVIAGATGSSFTISSATGADTANYTVVATNSVGSAASAAASVAVVSPTMSATALTPGTATARNPDTRLTVTFNQAPVPGVSGYLRIYDAATNAVVDTIDLVAATALRDSLRAVSTLSTQLLPVQKKPIGGIVTDFNYYPITISGNTATIYPRNGALGYGRTYYVKVDAGVFVNAAGEAFAGINDTTSWRFATKGAAPGAGSTRLTVAADGSGDFDTVQAALDFIPAGNTTPTTILVKRGIYFEEIGFQSKHFVTLLGEDIDQAVITYPNNNTFNNVSGVYHRATLVAQAVHDFTLANLTINNPTPQNGSQAEAIVINGSSATTGRNLVTRCKFFSYQDTVQFNKQTYISDSTIWGDVDFMWGDGPAFFLNCDIRILRSGAFFTQVRNGSSAHGFVFVGCRFTAPAGIAGTYLGRIDPAGFPFSEVAVLDSTFGDATNNAFLNSVTGVSGSNYLGGWWILNNAASAAAAPNVHNWSNGLLNAAGAPLINPNADGFTTMPTDATTQSNYRNATWVLNTSLAGAVNGTWTPSLAPLIAVPPATQTVDAGNAATFTVTAIAIPAPAYQWRKNGADIPGATAATYTIPVARGTDTGSYTVVVTNSAGATTSAEAILTVAGELVAPTITTQPASQLIAEGATGTLSVAALGTLPLSYQWQKDGAPIPGATGPSFTIAGATLADAGVYRVIVSNLVGDAPSDAAVVTVKGIAAIARSGYAAGVTGGAGGETVTVSTAAQLKGYAESATPYIIVVAGTIDLGDNGRIKLQSNKTLRGATTASTILGSVNISNVNNVIVSNLTISADTGEPSTNDGVTIANSTNVLVTKCTIFNCTDGNLDVINGSDLVTVSWCKFYYTRDNGHNFSNLVGSSDTDVGSGDGVTNYRVTWHHNWWTGLARQRMIACRFGSSHMFNNYWDCAGNDYCTESRNVASVFSEHNHYDGVKNPLGKRTAQATDIGRLMTIGNIFEACTGTQATGADTLFTPPYSYGLDAPAAVRERVMAGAGNVTADDAAVPGASIASSAPFGSVGGSLALTAAPEGFTPVSYQWRRNNAAIPGAVSATLAIASIQPSDAGAYTVVLGLGDGSAVVSSPHAVTVKFPPSITTQPVSRVATVGDTVTFVIAATGDVPLAYQWHKDGVTLGGAVAPVLDLPGITTAAAGGYHCVVTNEAGSVASGIAALTVQKAAATVNVTGATVTFDGSPKIPDVTTAPAGLPITVTYNGAADAPVAAGSYTVNATVDHVDYVGSGSGTLVIDPAMAGVTLAGLDRTFDGEPQAVTVTTVPAGLPVSLTYAGGVMPPTDAGSYAVAATVVHPNYIGAASATLVIGKASATIALAPLTQAYDGTPKPVAAAASPAGLPVTVTYNGGAAAPIYPGTHTVSASIDSPNYSGAATGTLTITITALVRHAPTIDGLLDGSVQVLAAGSATLNGNSAISGDLLVPGMPSLQINGNPVFVGVVEGPGAATPTGHGITLNGRAALRYLVRRINAISLPAVPAPLPPAGSRSVVVNRPSDLPGDSVTLRDLTLNGNAGTVALPAGAYGSVAINGANGLVLGQAGAIVPALYEIQNLALNGQGAIQLAGPVILRLAAGTTFSGKVGNAANPAWLKLEIHSGGLALNGGAELHGDVVAPDGTVTIGGNASLTGSVAADRLILSGNSLLQGPQP